jgi:predicted nucleic acid-binding protein
MVSQICSFKNWNSGPRPETDVILSIEDNSSVTDVDARRWTQMLGHYRKPGHVRSIADLAITFVPELAD